MINCELDLAKTTPDQRALLEQLNSASLRSDQGLHSISHNTKNKSSKNSLEELEKALQTIPAVFRPYLRKAEWKNHKYYKKEGGKYFYSEEEYSSHLNQKIEKTKNIKSFIQTALNNRKEKGRLHLGKIEATAQKRIADIIGNNVYEVYTDMDSVRHIYQEKHNLESYDLVHALEVINTATDITLSNEKHADSAVLVFKKNINNVITFLAEIHVKKGYLLVFNCWRQRKLRNRSDAAQEPPRTNVRNVTPQSNNSPQNENKSSKNPLEELEKALETIPECFDKDLVLYYMRKAEWIEGKHPRDKSGKFTAVKNLKDNIHAILHGSPEEKRALHNSHFHIADTPQFMKELKHESQPILSGDYFTVSYGVIARHRNKDSDHNLTEQNWADLCNAITKPFAIVKHDRGVRIFTEIKTRQGNYIVAGVSVKNAGRNLEINSIETAFGFRNNPINAKIIYKSKKITPDQTALLEQLNSASLPPDQGLHTISHNIRNKSSKNSLEELEKALGRIPAVFQPYLSFEKAAGNESMKSILQELDKSTKDFQKTFEELKKRRLIYHRTGMNGEYRNYQENGSQIIEQGKNSIRNMREMR